MELYQNDIQGHGTETVPGSCAFSPLAIGLVRGDAASFFAEYFSEIHEYWVSLLQKTTLPPDTTHTDPIVKNAFRELDKTIATKTGSRLMSRLANVQLTRMLASLKIIIKRDRQTGRNYPDSGKTAETVAADIYVSIQSSALSPEAQRALVHQRVRIAKRWAILAGASPLLIITHSPKAERIMYVNGFPPYYITLRKCSANLSIKHQDLVALRDETSRCYPTELVRASDHLTQIGESGMAGDLDQTNHNLQKLKEVLSFQRPAYSPSGGSRTLLDIV